MQQRHDNGGISISSTTKGRSNGAESWFIHRAIDGGGDAVLFQHRRVGCAAASAAVGRRREVCSDDAIGVLVLATGVVPEWQVVYQMP